MRTKVTLILILLNVVLLGVIISANRKWDADAEIAKRNIRVLRNEVIGLKQIEITAINSPTVIRLERAKENDPWTLKSPIEWPANDFAVRRIVHELEFLDKQSSFPVADLAKNNQSLADYGLNPPRMLLTLKRDEMTTRLAIGDTSKVGNRLYVLSPDGKDVCIVNHSLAETLITGLEQLRTDTLFTIPVFEVRSVGLQNASTPRVRLRRDGAYWSFESPINARAGKSETEVLISSLNALRVTQFIEENESFRRALNTPLHRITLEGNNRRETLLLGASVGQSSDKAAEAFVAQIEGRPTLFAVTLPAKLLETINLAQVKLRDTRVLDFKPGDVTSISLNAPGQAEPLVLRHDDAAVGTTTGWQIVRRNGPSLPADGKMVENLLKRLSLLSVTARAGESGFLRDAPSDAELENYGFKLPEREVTLTLPPPATGPVNTTPVTLTLQLGMSNANGGTVQARVVGQPYIYAVPPDTLNALPISANVYRDRTVRALPEGTQITALSLVANDAPDSPLLSVTLPEGKTWDDVIAAAPASQRDVIKTLLEQLRTLRAKRYVSDTFTDTIFVDGQPTPWSYRLEAKLALGGSSPAQTSTTTLYLGQRAGGGTQLAGLKDPAPGLVFEVEQALLDAVWTITYAQRDPGQPPAPKPPVAAP